MGTDTLREASTPGRRRFSAKLATAQVLKAAVAGTDNFIAKAKCYTAISKLMPELLRLSIKKLVSMGGGLFVILFLMPSAFPSAPP